MKCRRIEKLIPLFVEGDLDAQTNNDVSLHLSDCSVCSRMVIEYNESQSWLRTYEMPDFDNTFYRDLQHSVMQEIERTKSRPTIWQVLTGPWNQHLAYAMAILMVMLVGAFVLYIYSGKTRPDSSEQRILEYKEEPQKEPEQKKNQPQPKLDEKKQENNFRYVKYPPRRVQPKRAKKPEEKLPLAMEQNSQPLDTLAINIFDKAMEMDPINLTGNTDSPISSESTRIEFQTSDPNIRIIWFAPKLNISQTSKIDTE